MRTFAYIFALALIIVPVSASAQVSIDPTSGNPGQTGISVTVTESETLIFSDDIFAEPRSGGSFGWQVPTYEANEFIFINFSDSVYETLWTQAQSEACTDTGTNSYSACLEALDNAPISYTLATFTVVPLVEGCTDPEANNYDPDAEIEDGSCTYTEAGIGFIVSSANTGFSDTTGFSFSDSVSWMGGILLAFVGVALATLWEMKYWIVAIIAIGGIVFFVFKGLRFFNTTGSLPSKKGVTVKK